MTSNDGKHGGFSVRALANSISNWIRTRIPWARAPQIGMREDEDATPARHNLVQPQERPPSDPERSERTFGMAEDHEDRSGSADLSGKRRALLESKTHD